MRIVTTFSTTERAARQNRQYKDSAEGGAERIQHKCKKNVKVVLTTEMSMLQLPSSASENT